MTISYRGFMRDRIQRQVVTIRPDASFHEARALIQDKGIRHLPVTDRNDRVVGLVTAGDIRGAAPSAATSLSVHELHYLLGKLKVLAFMTPKDKLITITPDTLIEQAVKLMNDNKISCLPVLEGAKLYGIFTETDALNHFVEIFGLEEKGTRLTIALEDKPGAMLGILEVFKKYDANVISIVTPSFIVEGKRITTIRIKTEDYEAIAIDLEKSGYKVLSIGKWPSV